MCGCVCLCLCLCVCVCMWGWGEWRCVCVCACVGGGLGVCVCVQPPSCEEVLDLSSTVTAAPAARGPSVRRGAAPRAAHRRVAGESSSAVPPREGKAAAVCSGALRVTKLWYGACRSESLVKGSDLCSPGKRTRGDNAALLYGWRHLKIYLSLTQN